MEAWTEKMSYEFKVSGLDFVAPPNFDSVASGRARHGELPVAAAARPGKPRKRKGPASAKGPRFITVPAVQLPNRGSSRSAMNEAPETLLSRISGFATAGVAARDHGEEAVAGEYFTTGFHLAMDAAKQPFEPASDATRLEVLCWATRLALENGKITDARRIMDEAFTLEPLAAQTKEWARLRDMDAWPDSWLIAAVRRDPPDTEALDRLAERHWKPLFARCQVLTLNFHKANDLGQEAWCRVLRARRTLKPGGNLPAYLATVATNLWRDRIRSARRAGPLSEERLLALDAALPDSDGQAVMLSDVLPDLNGLQTHERAMMALDIDKALERLSTQLRDVLVSRYLIGESCAEIGRRYGRTEQTISSWVRAAVREVKSYFEEQTSAAERKEAR